MLKTPTRSFLRLSPSRPLSPVKPDLPRICKFCTTSILNSRAQNARSVFGTNDTTRTRTAVFRPWTGAIPPGSKALESLQRRASTIASTTSTTTQPTPTSAPSTRAPQTSVPPITAAQTSQSTSQTERASLQASSSPSTSSLPPYAPPTTGVLTLLPPSWLPYAELARLDKPVGAVYLFFPCLFSTLLACSYTSAPVTTLLSTGALFAAGSLIMRGAGCTINDLWDRNLDPFVSRTRLRPLARRAVTPFAAFSFFGAQCLTGLVVLLQFPQPACLIWGAPSLLLVATYPLAKRVTHYPQVVLGLAFSWGALMGFPALGVDLLADQQAATAAGLLYASCVAWTVLYDMVYACMDVHDDKKAGVKSIALRFEENPKRVLAGLAVLQTGLLAGLGGVMGLGPWFFGGSCGGAVATLATMIWSVRLNQPESCWWWFRWGSWFTGGAISLGLMGEYLSGEASREDNSEKEDTQKAQ